MASMRAGWQCQMLLLLGPFGGLRSVSLMAAMPAGGRRDVLLLLELLLDLPG